jgi:hypothetical protein
MGISAEGSGLKFMAIDLLGFEEAGSGNVDNKSMSR